MVVFFNHGAQSDYEPVLSPVEKSERAQPASPPGSQFLPAAICTIASKTESCAGCPPMSYQPIRSSVAKEISGG